VGAVGIPVVLRESIDSAVDAVDYVYAGAALISQHRGGRASFYLADGQRSIRLLTDEAGHVTEQYDYDAFGNLTTQSTSGANVYLFAGEQFDAGLGLYNLRARLYDPQLGRFTGRDPFSGRLTAPTTLHPYLYGANNPVNARDPRGAQTLGDTAVANAVTGNLITLAEASLAAFPEEAGIVAAEAGAEAGFEEITAEIVFETIEEETVVATTEANVATESAAASGIEQATTAIDQFAAANEGTILRILRQFASLATRFSMQSEVAVLRQTVLDAIENIESLPGGARALCAVFRGVTVLGLGFGTTAPPLDAIIADVLESRLISAAIPCP
jgi:RHS repeat-associated protein